MTKHMGSRPRECLIKWGTWYGQRSCRLWCQPAVWESACRVPVRMSFNPSAIRGKRLKRPHSVLAPIQHMPTLLSRFPSSAIPFILFLQSPTMQVWFMLWDSECVSMHNRWDELREHGSWSTSGIYGGVRCVKWRMGCHTDVVVNTLVPCQQAQMTDTACLLRASCFKRRSSLRACSVWHFFFFRKMKRMVERY